VKAKVNECSSYFITTTASMHSKATNMTASATKDVMIWKELDRAKQQGTVVMLSVTSSILSET